MNFFKLFLRKVSYSCERLMDHYLLLQYRNRPFIEYYAAIINGRSKNEYSVIKSAQWEAEGRMQFRYLLEQGLQPHHTLLDFGCGSLGAGVFFIEYLQEGKYTGVDISSGIISVANYVMREKHLEFKHPSVSVIADMTCTGMGNKKFDYIFAYSVLSHMPKEDVDELFMNIRKIMTETTLFYASYFESSEKYYTSVSRRNFHYPYLLLKELADKHHLRLERMPGTTDNGKQNFLKITMLQ